MRGCSDEMLNCWRTVAWAAALLGSLGGQTPSGMMTSGVVVSNRSETSDSCLLVKWRAAAPVMFGFSSRVA